MKRDLEGTTPTKKWRVAGLAMLVALLLLAAVDSLEYRSRGDRKEGARPAPVSGYDLVLIGAMVDGGSAVADLPENIAVRFYLKEKAGVFLTVREREPQKYYWLDEVVGQEWRGGVTNSFSWPSAAVLRPLEVDPANLVVLARLDKSQPSGVETVAPVVLEPQQVPSRIAKYRFIFKLNSRAKIGCKIFRGESTEPLEQRAKARESAGPFEVSWNASEQPAGRYRLKLSGHFLNDNEPIQQEVLFDHQPVWPR